MYFTLYYVNLNYKKDEGKILHAILCTCWFSLQNTSRDFTNKLESECVKNLHVRRVEYEDNRYYTAL